MGDRPRSKLPFERIDVGGAFGKTKEPFYLAMNPNSLVPTLEEEDGFTMWESNSIVRYLAGKHAERHARARRSCKSARRAPDVDGLAALGDGAGDHAGVLGPDPHAAGKARSDAIEAGKEKTVAAAKIMDAQLGKTQFMAGDEFSYGDIPVGIMIYRYMQLIPERPATPNLERWYAAISSRARRSRSRSRSVPLS